MVYLITILLYMFFLVGVGIYKSRQVKTGDDFAVAGRSLSPWVTMLTMLAVWIGTGSIVGAAEQTYKTGLNAMFLPVGTLFGMLILTRIAGKARGYDVYTVPEIIGVRYGRTAKMLAVISLITAYMVIVSYQFNAGGAVLEVIGGNKEPVMLQAGDQISYKQISSGAIRFKPDPNYIGVAILELDIIEEEHALKRSVVKDPNYLDVFALKVNTEKNNEPVGDYTVAEPNFTGELTVGVDITKNRQLLDGTVLSDPNFTDNYSYKVSIKNESLELIKTEKIVVRIAEKNKKSAMVKDLAEREKDKNVDIKNLMIIKQGDMAKYSMVDLSDTITSAKTMVIKSLPQNGQLVRIDPVFTAASATIIAAIFIVIFTMIAGMKSLASCDTYNGSLIIIALVIALPILFFKAGGFSGMTQKFAEMGDKPNHMELFGTFRPLDYINWLLPTFLLVMGDANQYQRFFSSKNVKGAKQAAYALVVVAIIVELLIIACAWTASSLTPDPANGKYILIYAARHYMPMWLGLVFMVTVVAIIISTADSFLLVPATTFMRDVYMKYINPNVNEKKIVLVSRLLVVVFGIIGYLVSLMFAKSTGFYAKAMLAYTIYGAAVTPCLVAAMFWKKATKAGAITSIIAGISSTILWNEVLRKLDFMPQFFKDMDAVLPAITISVLSLVVISLLTYDKENTNELTAKSY